MCGKPTDLGLCSICEERITIDDEEIVGVVKYLTVIYGLFAIAEAHADCFNNIVMPDMERV